MRERQADTSNIKKNEGALSSSELPTITPTPGSPAHVSAISTSANIMIYGAALPDNGGSRRARDEEVEHSSSEDNDEDCDEDGDDDFNEDKAITPRMIQEQRIKLMAAAGAEQAVRQPSTSTGGVDEDPGDSNMDSEGSTEDGDSLTAAAAEQTVREPTTCRASTKTPAIAT